MYVCVPVCDNSMVDTTIQRTKSDNWIENALQIVIEQGWVRKVLDPHENINM